MITDITVKPEGGHRRFTKGFILRFPIAELREEVRHLATSCVLLPYPKLLVAVLRLEHDSKGHIASHGGTAVSACSPYQVNSLSTCGVAVIRKPERVIRPLQTMTML